MLRPFKREDIEEYFELLRTCFYMVCTYQSQGQGFATEAAARVTAFGINELGLWAGIPRYCNAGSCKD